MVIKYTTLSVSFAVRDRVRSLKTGDMTYDQFFRGLFHMSDDDSGTIVESSKADEVVR